jgi:hypothetical protein
MYFTQIWSPSRAGSVPDAAGPLRCVIDPMMIGAVTPPAAGAAVPPPGAPPAGAAVPDPDAVAPPLPAAGWEAAAREEPLAPPAAGVPDPVGAAVALPGFVAVPG